MEDAVKFLKENGLMKGWRDDRIKHAIDTAIRTCALTYTTDGTKLTGLVFGYWYVPAKAIHITGAAGNLMTFVRYLKSVFPECSTIRAYRKGKLIEYKVGKNL